MIKSVMDGRTSPYNNTCKSHSYKNYKLHFLNDVRLVARLCVGDIHLVAQEPKYILSLDFKLTRKVEIFY